ncbi:MAG: 2-oxoacid:acceptor oxidoreductase family protein [Planctomycetota bacterium]|jgi:2-oxoglutarate ferredoxin oxidoreductase subunit gamma
MVETEVLMAGFGGQGMLLAGEILAHAAMDQGLEVSWLPSYGPEMRGGTANVMVRISEKPIGSPLISDPRGLIVMNLPSLEKFAPKVRPGGVIVVNTSLIPKDADRADCTVITIPAREMAQEAGTDRAANFVMLGAYVGATGVVPPEVVEKELENKFTGRKAKFAPANIAAFRAGLAAGQKVQVTA